MTATSSDASSFRADPRAPAFAEVQVDVAAPADVVWDALCDVPHWSEWVAGVSGAQLDGARLEGAGFWWRSGTRRMRSMFLRLEESRRVVWMERTFGTRAIHEWQIEPTPEGCRVFSRKSVDGWWARPFARGRQIKLQQFLTTWARALEPRSRLLIKRRCS